MVCSVLTIFRLPMARRCLRSGVLTAPQTLWIWSDPAAAKSLQSCPTLCDPMDCSLPDFSIHGVLQARTLEWVSISFSNAWKWKVKSLSHIQLLATPWTAAYQVPPSMGFSGQQYWSGVPLPSPWSDPKRWFSGGCYRMRPQGGSTASCPRRFPLATGVLENSPVPGLEIRVRNARAPVSLLLPLLPAPARQIPSSAETVMLRVLFYFDGGTFQSSFRLQCPKSFKHSRLARAVGGPAWIWGLGSYPQGTRHSTSKEGSFAGTSSTAPSVQPPSSPSLGPHAAQAPGMWPQPRSLRPGGNATGTSFLLFSL